MKMNIDFWPKNPKANFRNGELNVSSCITMNYEHLTINYGNKNKPKSNPIYDELADLYFLWIFLLA